MTNKSIITRSIINALGVIVYVLLVASIFTVGKDIFGPMPGLFGPFVFLLLFVLSAAIVGSLIFGKPAFFFLMVKRKKRSPCFSTQYFGFLLLLSVRLPSWQFFAHSLGVAQHAVGAVHIFVEISQVWYF